MVLIASLAVGVMVALQQMKKTGDPHAQALGRTKIKQLGDTVKKRERAPLHGCLVKIVRKDRPHWHHRQGQVVEWHEKTDSYVVKMKDPIPQQPWNHFRTNEFK